MQNRWREFVAQVSSCCSPEFWYIYNTIKDQSVRCQDAVLLGVKTLFCGKKWDTAVENGQETTGYCAKLFNGTQATSGIMSCTRKKYVCAVSSCPIVTRSPFPTWTRFSCGYNMPTFCTMRDMSYGGDQKVYTILNHTNVYTVRVCSTDYCWNRHARTYLRLAKLL